MPRNINGATEPGKSIPCARPHAVTTPPYFNEAQILAKVWLPTESIAAAKRSFCSGLPGFESSSRLITFAAPSSFK